MTSRLKTVTSQEKSLKHNVLCIGQKSIAGGYKDVFNPQFGDCSQPPTEDALHQQH